MGALRNIFCTVQAVALTLFVAASKDSFKCFRLSGRENWMMASSVMFN